MKDTLNILKDIVSISSYVDKTHNEYNLINYIRDFVKKYKKNLILEEQLVETNRYNLIIRDTTKINTLLFGHLDTVLPKEETKEPFTPKVEEDKLYGLGAVDMKCGIAIMLDIIKNNHKPGVGYIFSVDEEYNFKGAFRLQQDFPFKPNLIINIEPTNLTILNGCRGITEFSFIIQGKAAHAGLKELGINAIEKSVEITRLLQKSISKYDSKENGKNSLNLAFLQGGIVKEKDEKGNIVINETGMNTVPDYAKVKCEIRIANKKIDKLYIEMELKRISSKLGVKITDIYFNFYLGPMFSSQKSLYEFEKAIKDAGENVVYRDINKSGYYEVQMLQETKGCNCVVFGPSPIEMSHCVNEYVEISSIEKTQKVIETYIKNIHK